MSRSAAELGLAGNRLAARTAALRAAGERGVAPYLTAGDGGLETTLAALHVLDRGGAACVELGVPFSDPIADGPVLQAAADRALAAGATLGGILAMVARFRQEGGAVPIALMSYANPLLRRGWDGTCAAAAAAGIDGLIVPDLALEEGAPLRAAAAAHGLCPIFFAAPTSPDDRIRAAAEASRGFLYVVGRTGVTGGGTRFEPDTQRFLERVAGLAALPTAVGFGIRSAEDVRQAVRHADLAIVGSALVARMHQAGAAAPEAAGAFLHELRQGLT